MWENTSKNDLSYSTEYYKECISRNNRIQHIDRTRNAAKYFEKLGGKKTIAVDWDNTLALDEWPEIGPIIPEAFEVLRELKRNGHKLFLNTQRTERYPICCLELVKYKEEHPERYKEIFADGHEPGGPSLDILQPCIDVIEKQGIKFDGWNCNPLWESIVPDLNRKIFADYYIDDHCVGMKYIIITNSQGEKCKVCDWNFIDRWFVEEGLYDKPVLEDNRVFSEEKGETYPENINEYR